MSLRNLSSGRVIGKAMPISYISKCPLLKNDVPSIPWLLISFSCLVFDVLFSISCSSPSHTIPHKSRPFFLSHNFGLGLLAGVYWFSYDLFRYQCIVRLSNLTQWTCGPKPVVVWLWRGRDCAVITLVILANYVQIRWHRSAYLWSPSFVCRSVISSLSKGKHAYPTLPPTGVYWFSYDLFRYQCIVRLSNLTQ